MTADKFSFTHAGETYYLPHLKDIKSGVIRKARKATDDADKFFTIIEEVCGEGSPELNAIDDMDGTELQATLMGWAQGAQLGESSSSSN
jgi:hypothetical protein